MADPKQPASGDTRATSGSPATSSTLGNVFSLNCMSPMVKVTIRDSAPFYVNYDLLVQSSDYFKRCLNSSFKESRDQSVRLDMDEEYFEAFGHYVQFIYDISGHDYNISNALSPFENIPNGTKEIETLAKRCIEQSCLHARIYILGERICSKGLKNVALKKFTRVLYVAYVYPHPTTYTAYGKDWSKWANTTWHLNDYREFCHGATIPTSPPGRKVVTQSLIQLNYITDLVQLIYQNTPDSNGAPGTLRHAIAQYCASIIEDLQTNDTKEKFKELMEDNWDFFRDLMKLVCFKNGAPLKV